jgi:hypothetical protein
MNENDFAQKLKPWLDRSAQQLGEIESQRLRSARLRAMDRWREPVRLLGLVPVNAGLAQTLRYQVIQPALLVLPIAALLVALALQSAGEADLGEIDAQLLTQELPPDAFLDQDFRSWLGKSHG